MQLKRSLGHYLNCICVHLNFGRSSIGWKSETVKRGEMGQTQFSEIVFEIRMGFHTDGPPAHRCTASPLHRFTASPLLRRCVGRLVELQRSGLR